MKRPAQGYSPAFEREQLQREGLYRKERIVEARRGVQIQIDGNQLINFCSNDYLGLASHPRISRAMQAAADNYGVGSTASPLVCGKSSLHDILERKLARLTGRDRALILSCGYMANLAILSALASSRAQTIFEDRLCHASMVDGAIISRATKKRYAHASPVALESILKNTAGKSRLVLTESVFSMDGDIAPLPELSQLCRQYHACLIVDDAHGFGVIGKQGLGGMDHFSLGQADVPLMMATFGKALGVYGAFIAGPDDLIDALVQRARPYIYSTALPAPVIAAVNEALDVMQEEPQRRNHLGSLIQRFQTGAAQCGMKIMTSNTPIQPVIVGDANKAVMVSRLLEQNGIFVSAIRPPTVPQNSSRLRITLSANHTDQHVDKLLSVLSCSLKKADVIAR